MFTLENTMGYHQDTLDEMNLAVEMMLRADDSLELKPAEDIAFRKFC